MVYVDDFKLAGPKEHMAKARALLRRHLDIEEARDSEAPKRALIMLIQQVQRDARE